MDEVKCENCPIASECRAYEEASTDNANSYRRWLNTVRVRSNDCPLVSLIKGLQEDKEAQ